MRIEAIANKHYAFGLTWRDVPMRPRRSDIAELRGALDPDGRGAFLYCVCEREQQFALGGGVPMLPFKGKVLSYAAALASTQPDGIYVAPTDDDKLWFVVIRGGLVTTETDRIDSPDNVRALVEQYRATFALPVHAAPDSQIPGSTEPFDPVAAVGEARTKPMRKLAGKLAFVPIIVAIAVVIAAIVGWRSWQSHRAQQQMSAEQRQQAIAAYMGAVRTSMQGFPIEASWIENAFERAQRSYPVYFAGWHLNEIECVPSGCQGTYGRSQNEATAVAPFTERFGIAAVQVDQKATAIRVRVPLATRTFVVDDHSVRNPPPKPMPLLDWLGVLPIHIPGVSPQTKAQAEDLAQSKGGKAVGFPSFVIETVTLTSNTAMDTSELHSITAWGGAGTFRVTSLTWTPVSAQASRWTAVLQRIHR